jgi:RNA polymerase sigma factor (sigma-70 family)
VTRQDVRKLTSAIASGNTEAFALFYETWFDMVYDLARHAARADETTCLDIVQDVMLRVIKALPRLESEAQVHVWLKRTVHRVCIDRFRAEQRRARREERRQVSTAPERMALLDERIAWLEAQLQTLDHEDAQLLLMRHRFGWTLARIGKTLGLSTSAVDRRLRRITGSLQQRASQTPSED